MTSVSDLIEQQRRALNNANLRNKLINIPIESGRHSLLLNGQAKRFYEAAKSNNSIILTKQWFEDQCREADFLSLESIRRIHELLVSETGEDLIGIGIGAFVWTDEKNGKERLAPIRIVPAKLKKSEGDLSHFVLEPIFSETYINEPFLNKIGLPTSIIPDDPTTYKPKESHAPIIGYRDLVCISFFSHARHLLSERLRQDLSDKLCRSPHIRFLLGEETYDEVYGSADSFKSKINEALSSQLCAPALMCDSDQYKAYCIAQAAPFSCISGPPGTGKSQTIANIIVDGYRKGHTFLITAPRNNALEVIVRRLKGLVQKSDMLLLSDPSLSHADLADRFGVESGSSISDMLRRLPLNRRPRIVLSTTLIHALRVPSDWQFDHLIIDEASQFQIRNTLLALASAKRVTVFGDRAQLRPNMQWERTVDGYIKVVNEDSLLERIAKKRTFSWSLKHHYRSLHQSLINHSNRHFYQGTLQTFPSPTGREIDAHGNLGLKHRYIQASFDNEAATNRDEAEALVAVLKKCVDDHPYDTIGIICMTEQQCSLVHDLARSILETVSFHKEPPFIMTPDHAQGEERDTILVSFTHGPRQPGGAITNIGRISSIDGPNRLNVALTRARKRMITFSSISSGDLTNVITPPAMVFAQVLRGLETEQSNVASTQSDDALVEIFDKHGLSLHDAHSSLIVRHKKSKRQTDIALIYKTGTCDRRDEISELTQLKRLGWTIFEAEDKTLEPDHPNFVAVVDSLIREILPLVPPIEEDELLSEQEPLET